jgi:hypothetical protein
MLKIYWRVFLLLSWVCIVVAPAQAESVKGDKVKKISELPLGLAWGDSLEKIEKEGLKLTELKAYRDGTRGRYLIERPSGKSPTICAMISVDDENGLVSIRWSEENINDDPFGKRGLAQYSRLKERFTSKYGKPVIDVDWMIDQYLGTAAFYNCLRQTSNRCGEIQTGWVGSDMSVFSSLSGVGSTGQIEIIYKHKSIFNELESHYHSQKYQNK